MVTSLHNPKSIAMLKVQIYSVVWSTLFLSLLNITTCQGPYSKLCSAGEFTRICIPEDYMKFELPSTSEPTIVTIGVDIKDIPKVKDKDFSITINAYFMAQWKDTRLEINERKKNGLRRTLEQYEQVANGTEQHNQFENGTEQYEPTQNGPKLIPVNPEVFAKRLWLPDVEIINLKEFETHKVLSKLEGIWIDEKKNILYALATRIIFFCPMKFNSFPMDIQVCKFQVGSFNYDNSKLIFANHMLPDAKTAVKSILDYDIDIKELAPDETHYVALNMNYSVAGFEMTLTRKMSFYVITYYLPSGLFVLVSWISFLVNPEVIPGRMTLLVIIFLVLINMFNTIQSNSPTAEGITAIESWVIACIIFVFGALCEYAMILFFIKLSILRREQAMERGIKTLVLLDNNGTSPSTKRRPNNDQTEEDQSYEDNHEIEADNSHNNSDLFGNGESRRVQKRKKITNKEKYTKLDITFLMVFPVMFILFNIFYWGSLYVWRSTDDAK